MVASLGSLCVHSTKAGKTPCIHGRCIIQDRWLCLYNVSMTYLCLYILYNIYCVLSHSMLRRNYDMEAPTVKCGNFSSAGHSLELRLTGQPLSS